MGDKNIVNELKKDHPAKKQCSEMFRLWLQQKNPSPSWETLISTLKDIGMNDVAKEILKEYQGTYTCMYICTYVYNNTSMSDLIDMYAFVLRLHKPEGERLYYQANYKCLCYN